MGERAAVTEVAMIRLATIMRTFPGRKSIIWIGEGLPYDQGFEPIYKHIIDTLNDANIALYPVDARRWGGIARWATPIYPCNSSPISLAAWRSSIAAT